MPTVQKSLYSEIAEIEKRSIPAVIVTVVESKGSAPQKSGSRMIVYSNGNTHGTVGGGAIEKEAIRQAMDLMNSKEPLLKEYSLEADTHMLCGGNMTLFFEPLNPPSPLYVFGGGHVCKALSGVIKDAGFAMTVIDNRPEFTAPERFPDINAVICKPYDQALSELTFTDHTFIVIVTHGHLHDQEILEYCVQQHFAYLGMIGSKRKVGQTRKTLMDKGITAERIDQIHSPIGLPIGGDSPAEIAISIAAEMIAVKNKIDTLAWE